MVVKIGSSTVVGADGKVNRAFIGGLPIRPQRFASLAGAWSW